MPKSVTENYYKILANTAVTTDTLATMPPRSKFRPEAVELVISPQRRLIETITSLSMNEATILVKQENDFLLDADTYFASNGKK